METGLMIRLGIILVVGIVIIWGFIVFRRAKVMEMIERNAIRVTPDPSWKDSEGNWHIEKVFVKYSRIPLLGGWAVINPILNEDKSTNYTNLLFGGKKNLIKLILILLVVAIFFFGVYDILNQSKILMENPCVINCITKINP